MPSKLQTILEKLQPDELDHLVQKFFDAAAYAIGEHEIAPTDRQVGHVVPVLATSAERKQLIASMREHLLTSRH